ncbi:MAG: aminoacyl-tRNA hydrolase, partial [Sphingobacteriales bacterium 12-47-4]
NGLKSLEEVLGTDQYPRLRFGIGNDYPKGKQADFVLGKWSEKELPLVRLKATKAVEAIDLFLLQGLTAAMNEVNDKEYSL